MLLGREAHVRARAPRAVMVVAGLAIAAIAAGPAPEAAKDPSAPGGPSPSTMAQGGDTLQVGSTRANLQSAFTNEMDARERYLAYAKRAQLEGYPYVAQLFRACAESEDVQGKRHVTAIAWIGGEARAVLSRVVVGSTEENLRAAIEQEAYEVSTYYPVLREKARGEHEPMAVRSMNFALSADREHLRLLAAALAGLDRRAPTGTLYVCPYCGKTVTSLDFRKCPNCFTRAASFTRVS
jgi:rubrerythrin